MTRYLERLFAAADRASERVKDGAANRVADRLADALSRRTAVVVLDPEQYEDYKATLETLEDPEAMASLQRAATESDDDARPYEDVRRELGLA
jgi:FtsZ-interacting cell division protein YlmF